MRLIRIFRLDLLKFVHYQNRSAQENNPNTNEYFFVDNHRSLRTYLLSNEFHREVADDTHSNRSIDNSKSNQRLQSMLADNDQLSIRYNEICRNITNRVSINFRNR